MRSRLSRLLVPVSVLILLLAGVFIRIMTNRPPESEVITAGKKLAEAQLARAPDYAKGSFREAGIYYDSAMVEWRRQNERFILFRNYKEVSRFARTSVTNSEQAIQRARESIVDTEALLGLRLENLAHTIGNFDKHFRGFPIHIDHQDSLARCRLLYTESLQAYYSKNYSTCQSMLVSVDATIHAVSAHYTEKLQDYFDAYPQWAAMVEKSISLSRKDHIPVLVVDKIARILYVYTNGRILREYPVELGSNWVGDKMQQGDKSTPEGHYKILEKKKNGQTSYHRAFLLDYPNDADKKRFTLNKKNGIINQNASIGNLIEIHGSGGKGTDWTDGCVALRDSHMEELFALCPVGTRVTIVGSTMPLNRLTIPLQ